ncbi:glycoside hydrolase family 31 protein [Actinoallomurus sp. CA-150999]|uniref:glycoside hydrolase family 31 protein n=1 Tax=Actinoallomurus sp. CA-150999 TaxID=3239887 RepID=UPI003D92E9DB
MIHRRTPARLRRRAIVPLLGLLLPLAFAPPGARAAESPAAWRVTAAPFGLTFLDHGRAITQEAGGTSTGPGGRLSYQVGGSATSQEGATYHRLTDLVARHDVRGGTAYTVATDEPGRTATVTVTRAPQGVRVRWSFAPSSDVTAVFEALTARGDEHYLGGSSAAYVDLRGHIRGWSPGKEGNEAGDYCQNQEQAASTFYLSSGGYGLRAATDHVGRFAFPGATQQSDGPTCAKTPKPPTGAAEPYPCPVAATAQPDRVQICVKDAELTYDVYTGSPAAVTNAYYRTVGLPGMPPASQFALMKWRDVNADQAQVLDDVAQMKKLDIPLGTIWIDNPWEHQPAGNTHRINGSACTNTGEFDPTFFPDPQKMIDSIHAQGVRFGLWVTSHVVSAPSSAQGGGTCAGLNDIWAKNGWLVPGTNYIDFTNPAARERYVEQLTRIFRMGVDMAKEDRAEEYRLETTQFAGGSGAGLYLRYPDLYQSAVTEAMRRAHGNDFETLVRAGVPGTAQHTHGMWGSDVFETFAGLRTSVRYGTSESLTGHFAWGSDTGGIDPQSPADATNSPTPSLFTRWAQFSAVSPVFEVGGAGLNATPWKYDADTVRRFRDAVVLHYELFPYLYGLARNAARTGVPILRAVGFQYPGDQAAWAQDQEFMVGPDLLAAPVTADRADADGAAGRPTPVQVYLPAGRWVDLYSGEVVDGGRTITRQTSLDEFPLYLRAGATIGFNSRVLGGWRTDELSKPGLTGWLYAPGADGTARFRVPATTGRAQVVVPLRQPPRSVTVDGRTLPRAADATALRAAGGGWTFTSGPFGGVVLTLTSQGHPADVTIR